jgi:microcin C transport system permease protein
MTPITKRRLQLFRANKRGFWSLWIFLILFTLSLFAEFIANDKPILLNYKGELYFPVFNTYSEQTFGGDFATEAMYREPFIAQKINENGWMLWPPIRYSYSTINYDLGRPAPAPPSSENLLGTDDQGRDVAARLIYGFRISVLFGLSLTLLSAVIGIFAGAVQGYFGGLTDLIFQRVIEIWSGLPELFVLIILASIVTPNFWWLLAILLLFTWMSLTAVVRAEFLRARNFDYVKAARALGVAEWRIMIRHVLPNAMVAAMTMIPFVMSGGVTALTTLDFLGFGLPPGSPSLGELLLQGKGNPQAPWLGFTGFITIALMLVLIIFISEAVRDAFDPRKAVKQ